MSLDEAIRLTEILMGLAFCQQSLEHLRATGSERVLHACRLLFSALLVSGAYAEWTLAALLVISLMLLHRFDGPYNGGSDRMGVLMLCCLCAAHWLPGERARELAIGYLAIQLTLSYVIAGLVKIRNSDWRSGQALADVFAFSTYPVSESLRKLSTRTRLLWTMSWAVMLLELLFPLSLFSTTTLHVALGLTAAFHLANACIFGLNRFFWIWLAAYPALLWFQVRITLF